MLFDFDTLKYRQFTPDLSSSKFPSSGPWRHKKSWRQHCGQLLQLTIAGMCEQIRATRCAARGSLPPALLSALHRQACRGECQYSALIN